MRSAAIESSHVKLAYSHIFSLVLVVTVGLSSESKAERVDSADVFDLELFSLSKHKEDSFDAPAAVHIITSEDIRRSGATTLPEVLRLAPGLQVAQQGAHKWVVGSRGFDFQFTNGLLVLVDGRTIYTPQFSGVFWDDHDVLLENIDKIEVIRGPGATVWGANAFNGVINIITKSAASTQGNSVMGSIGTNDNQSFSVRHGGKLSEDGFYRIFAKRSLWGSFDAPNGTDANDSWENSEVGFRTDWNAQKNDKFTVQGNLKEGQSSNYFANLPTLSTPFVEYNPRAHKFRGANTIAKWDHEISPDSKTSTQFFYDYIADHTGIVNRDGTTLDVDFQHVVDANPINQITWGLGYRYIIDNVSTDDVLLTYRVHDRRNSLYSTFLQDKIRLVPDKLYLTVGSKLEHNDYTGFEMEPSAKLAYYPDDKQTIWSSVTRAVRTPSRGEYDSTPRLVGTSTGYIARVSDPSYTSEKLIAYELGYRIRPEDTLVLEAAAFYNVYDQLRTFESGIIAPFGNVAVPSLIANNGTGESQGIELNAKWQAMDKWRLLANYSFLNIDLHRNSSNDAFFELVEGQSPQHQFGVHSFYTIQPSLELNNNFYYVDNRPNSGAAGINAYTRVDVGLIWRPSEQVEVSLSANNLFTPSHAEYQSALFAPYTEVPRTVFLKTTVDF